MTHGLQDQKILDELELREHVSVIYVMRKYRLTYEKSRELQNRWAANEPKAPTFDELFAAYTIKARDRNASQRNCSAS